MSGVRVCRGEREREREGGEGERFSLYRKMCDWSCLNINDETFHGSEWSVNRQMKLEAFQKQQLF